MQKPTTNIATPTAMIGVMSQPGVYRQQSPWSIRINIRQKCGILFGDKKMSGSNQNRQTSNPTCLVSMRRICPKGRYCRNTTPSLVPEVQRHGCLTKLQNLDGNKAQPLSPAASVVSMIQTILKTQLVNDSTFKNRHECMMMEV